MLGPQTGNANPQSNGPIAQSRLERTPDKREVVGSIPTRPTTFRGCSSVGRAPALHAGGHRFDSVHLHQNRFCRSDSLCREMSILVGNRSRGEEAL